MQRGERKRFNCRQLSMFDKSGNSLYGRYGTRCLINYLYYSNTQRPQQRSGPHLVATLIHTYSTHPEKLWSKQAKQKEQPRKKKKKRSGVPCPRAGSTSLPELGIKTACRVSVCPYFDFLFFPWAIYTSTVSNFMQTR